MDRRQQDTPEPSDRQIAFRDSLFVQLIKRFNSSWIDRLAATAQREIKAAAIEKKAETFQKHLGAACNWILEMQELLIRDLTRYVQANQHEFYGDDAAWVDARLEEIWSALFTPEAYRGWVACACDSGSDISAWRAPTWLKQWDGHAATSAATIDALAKRLDEVQTAELIGRIAGSVEIRRAHAKTERISAIHVLMCRGEQIPRGLVTAAAESGASVPETSPGKTTPSNVPQQRSRRHQRRKSKEELQREAQIRRVISNGSKGLQYCRELDHNGITPPRIWIARGCPKTYAEAYRSGWDHHIQNQKYRLTPTPRTHK